MAGTARVRRRAKAAVSFLLALCMTFCMMVSLSAVALADETKIATDVGCVTGDGVRMRMEPDTSSLIVDLVARGTAIAVRGEENGWYRVSLDGLEGYIRSDLMILDQDGVFTAKGIVNADDVNIRDSASTDGGFVGSTSEGTYVTVTGFQDGWYSIETARGTKGYIRSDLLDLTVKPEPAPVQTSGSSSSSGTSSTSSSSVRSSASSSGNSVVSVARQCIGIPYVWGGASSSGVDCSGFTMYVYGKFGVSLPHSATSQWQSGLGTRVYSMSALRAGDLVFFCDPSESAGKACSHTGIYIGNGQMIHASSSRGCVTTASLYSSYYTTYFVGGLHIL